MLQGAVSREDSSSKENEHKPHQDRWGSAWGSQVPGMASSDLSAADTKLRGKSKEGQPVCSFQVGDSYSLYFSTYHKLSTENIRLLKFEYIKL